MVLSLANQIMVRKWYWHGIVIVSNCQNSWGRTKTYFSLIDII